MLWACDLRPDQSTPSSVNKWEYFVFRQMIPNQSDASWRNVSPRNRVSSEFGEWVVVDEVSLAAESATISARWQLSSNELQWREVGIPRQKTRMSLLSRMLWASRDENFHHMRLYTQLTSGLLPDVKLKTKYYAFKIRLLALCLAQAAFELLPGQLAHSLLPSFCIKLARSLPLRIRHFKSRTVDQSGAVTAALLALEFPYW